MSYKVKVPKPDVLKAGIAHAEENLKHWNQLDWFSMGTRFPDEKDDCGTTACLAGHILLAQGMSWKEVSRLGSIRDEALKALGFKRTPIWWGESWDENAANFDNQVFCYTRVGNGDFGSDPLAYEESRMNEFKARVTEVTGVEF